MDNSIFIKILVFLGQFFAFSIVCTIIFLSKFFSPFNVKSSQDAHLLIHATTSENWGNL
jgi:hypothetical protein